MIARRLNFAVSGLLFGAGLAVCRMIDPAKVLGFLTLRDFSLAVTMAAAVAVTAACYRLAARRGVLPPRNDARPDARLLAGSALFGLGWGLAGMCPAPALAVLPMAPGAAAFVLGLVAGTVLAMVGLRVFVSRASIVK
jgi:hypothetical protein